MSARGADTFDPTLTSADYIDTGGGPSGLILDEARNRLYVMTRFDNTISVIDLTNDSTLLRSRCRAPASALPS